MKDQTKVIVALAAGVAVGALLGILLAPEKGEESRKKVAGLAKDIIDSAKDLADQVLKNSNTGAEDDPETTLGV